MSFNNSKRSIHSSSNSDTSPLKKKTKIALKRSFTHSSSSSSSDDIPVVWLHFSRVFLVEIIERYLKLLAKTSLMLHLREKGIIDRVRKLTVHRIGVRVQNFFTDGSRCD
jgi:hypothetical protein